MCFVGAGKLIELDYATGKTVQTLVQFEQYSGNGGAATIGPNRVVYSCLLEFQNENAPYWITVDLADAKNQTITPVGQTVPYPYLLGLAFL